MSDPLPEEFSIEIVGGGDGCVVKLFGELDLVSADGVHDAIVACSAERVVVDLSNVEFIDSTGLAALLVARRELEAGGRGLELRGAAGATRRIFDAIGVADVLDD